jgi:hypothetical protein
MSIIVDVTIIFLSVLKIFKGDCPVTLGNAVSKFQHLYYDFNKDINGISANWELKSYVESLIRLNDKYPLRLLEIGKESHSLAFNYILHLVREESLPYRISLDHALDCLESFKISGVSVFTSVDSFIFEAARILTSLKLKDQWKNEESFKIIDNLMAIASEFTYKIQDLRERERKFTICRNIEFVTENLVIDYQNGTIDYEAFMEVFFEIKSLYLAKTKDRNLKRRLKKLKYLFDINAHLIRKSQCYLVFDFYPIEELFFLIIRNKREPRKIPFKDIFLGPKEKNLALEKLCNLYSIYVFGRLGKSVIGAEVYQMNIKQYIKKRFFTKLVNFLKVKDNYDYFNDSGHPELDYYQWVYTGLSKIEYYLNSSKDFEME